MIAQIRGIMLGKTTTEAIIECAGIGYQVSISLNTSSKLPDIGSEVLLKTIFVPREDQFQLFGFFDDNERELFKMLTSISGIGGKTALGILSSVSPEELAQMVVANNLISLQKLPGVGKKTAERLLLELKDKVTKISFDNELDYDKDTHLIRNEALAAMITLGYSRVVAEKAIKTAINSSKNKSLHAEDLIRDALRYAMQ